MTRLSITSTLDTGLTETTVHPQEYVSPLYVNSTGNDVGVAERDKNTIPVLFRACLIIFISLAIVTSNLLNILVLRLTKQIPLIARMCLLNLSVADLLVGVVCCVPCIFPAITGVWPYGEVWCQLAGITHGTSVTISIYSLALISVDRYLAILYALRYPLLMTPFRCYTIMTVMWFIASITFCIPLLTKANFIYYRFGASVMMCGLYWEYPWFCLLTAVYIPILAGSVLLFTTVRIVRTVSKMNQVHVANHVQTGDNPPAVQFKKSDIKAVKVLIITTVVYFLMWGPYVTEVVIISISSVIVPSSISFATIWIANSNSFMNVIIYSMMYKSFRKNCVWVIQVGVSRLFCQTRPDRPSESTEA